MKPNGTKPVRINSIIAESIEKLAEFFNISSAEASVIIFTTSFHDEKYLWNKMKRTKLKWVRRHALEKIQKSSIRI